MLKFRRLTKKHVISNKFHVMKFSPNLFHPTNNSPHRQFTPEAIHPEDNSPHLNTILFDAVGNTHAEQLR